MKMMHEFEKTSCFVCKSGTSQKNPSNLRHKTILNSICPEMQNNYEVNCRKYSKDYKKIESQALVMNQTDVHIKSLVFNLDPFMIKKLKTILTFGNSFIDKR